MDLPPLPPPSRRRLHAAPRDAQEVAVRLLWEHRSVLAALGTRSAADFRPLPTLWSSRRAALRETLDADHGLRASLVGEIAALLAPRLERLAGRLRRRMSRRRKELALPRLREMDPACLRSNGRRPGRSLVEKAGPRQQLRGVVRVESFDTTENRVLRAAVVRLQVAAKDVVSGTAREQVRATPEGRALVRLLRASEALAARPELADLGPPRVGERPSNALLRDADYRAAWRALRLLRREEQSFVEEWARLPELWFEMVVAAAWSVIDASGAEPLPGWTRVREHASDGRFDLSDSRSWVSMGLDSASWLTMIADRPSREFVLRVDQVSAAGSRREQFRWPVAFTSTSDGADSPLSRALDPTSSPEPDRAAARRAAVAVLADHLPPTGVPDPAETPDRAITTDGPEPCPFVGLCPLDRVTWVASTGRPLRAVPTAVAEIPADGEPPLVLVGRPATWRDSVLGPTDLAFGSIEHARRLVRSLAGRETAVVVRDDLDEYALDQLRPPERRTWTVWAPVAAALVAADRFDEALPLPAEGETVSVEVSIDTDAVAHVTRLELRSIPVGEAREREWIRLPRTASTSPGSEELAEIPDRGIWLREGWGGAGWTIKGGALHRGVAPRRPSASWSPHAAGDVPVSARIACGTPPAPWAQEEPAVPLLRLDPPDLARGAAVFLRRQAGGLPTWVERLPRLELLARRGRERHCVPLIPAGKEVKPGALVEQNPERWFTLPAGERRIDLPLHRDGERVPLSVHLDGPPLPLKEDLQVGVSVRFRHGLEGIEGHLVAREPGPLTRLAFKLRRTEASGTTDAASAAAPDWPAAPPPPPRTAEDILAACRRLQALRQVVKGWRRPTPGDGTGTALRGALKELVGVLRKVGEPSEDCVPGAVPVLQELVPWLDWLLGVERLKGEGRAPDIRADKELLALIVEVRARTTLPGSGYFAKALCAGAIERDPHRRLRWIARVCRSAEGPDWRFLLDADPSDTELGAWARAMEFTLTRVPGLAAGIDLRSAPVLLRRTIDRCERLGHLDSAALTRRKQDLHALLVLVAACTLTREGGRLLPDDPVVVQAAERLERLAEVLPSEIRSYGESGAPKAEDEAVRVAIDYLRGQYRALPYETDP